MTEHASDVWTAEEKFMLQCVQAAIDTPDRPDRGVPGDLNWERVIRTAQLHGGTPLVHRAVSNYYADAVPEEVAAEFKRDAESTTRQNLSYIRELIAVLEALREADIRAIPYRGPVLAIDAYGDLGMRQFGDIDLLVRRDDIPRARTVLLERDYESISWDITTDDLGEWQRQAYTRFCRDYPFYREANGVELELHWRYVSLHFPSSFTLESVWDRREKTTFSGHELPVLSPEDRMLMMCIHGSRHNWERLQWITDVATFIQRRDVDWSVALERAEAHNSRRMFALGPLLAAELFGVELPPVFERVQESDPKLSTLTSKYKSLLFRENYPRRFATPRAQSKLIERPRDKAKFWLHWAFLPDRPEIEAVDLPPALLQMYRVIRPLRLLSLAGRRAIGRPRPEREQRTET